ncbi:N-acetylglucosamine-specific PTS transporter subunit IIBC [Salinicoccus hispanicus]|uniref:PTS transporter subunit EIIC n=1 Tax=Salinicoccus hispanicus TaxID=157225 RepID=A0A6N8U2K8_9STAP|nr:N-acetylglucosamine-specific PTS transporter subunit IIBC [Salinicoccus hispanicus]MXQ51963.1 PTS transporter subunit EIIC [Salinicoccus hispanicus]
MLRYIQNMGRAFMLPVAVLPAAALLLGIGYAIDPEGWGEGNAVAGMFIAAGNAILNNLAILFAVGLAFGMSKDKNGAAAIAGLVSFLVVTTLLSADSVALLRGIEVEAVGEAFGVIENNVFIGIITGLVSAALYNRFSGTKLPDYLAFFSGRRAVPIIAVFVMVAISGILYFVWPLMYNGLFSFGEWISGMGALGAGIYGFFNRLLIPTGLHHALNSVFWFDTVGINDIGNFWNSAGEEGITGRYQAGFFPIMMFGLPGAALAMYHTAKTEYKKVAGSILLAASLTAFLTGVTEPLEFSFMFLAPLLYVIHALLTGLSLFIAALFEWTAGFGFSAGLIDFVLSTQVPIANQPYMLMVQGVAFFVIYYVIFRVVITALDLKTPGRTDAVLEAEAPAGTEEGEDLKSAHNDKYSRKADQILIGLGGKENIDTVDYCTTRLRMNLHDDSLIDEEKIKAAGAHGVIKPGKNNVHVVVGTEVEHVAEEMKRLL